jgi:hypothetical protein
MAKVTDILTRILTDQARRTISGSEAVRRILEETRRQVIVELSAAPVDGFAAYQLPQVLAAIEKHLATFEASARTSVGSGLSGSWDEGVALLPSMAAESGITLSTFGISHTLLDQLKEFTWGKITSVKSDAVARIRGELTLGVLGQKTPHEITLAIAGNLERPGVFQSILDRAEVITKTELGRTFSMAAQAGMEAAGDTLPELQKMWLHTGHPKQARPYHLRLNGDVKNVDQPFLVGNISMMYPRDPKAPVSEIINCGCMHVPYMAEWGTKKEFVRSWEKAQKAANSKQ